MVYLKVSDGNETRRLQVTPGEISFEQLKEQLATFFPQTLSEGSSSLSLQYRDADSDVITLSSDQELQDALSQIQENGTWKLYIRNSQCSGGARKSPSSSQRSQSGKRNGCEASLFHHLLGPSVKPFGLFSDVWDDLEQHLQLLHQLHSELFSNDSKEATKSEKDTPETTSNSKTAADTTSSSTDRQSEDPDEVVKSKPQATDFDKKEESSSNGGDSSSSESVWQTRKFVTWEPRVHIGPFGFFHSRLTPVVYKVSFRSSNGGCCSASKEDNKTESETQEHAEPAGPVKEEEISAKVLGSGTTDKTQAATSPESVATTTQ